MIDLTRDGQNKRVPGTMSLKTKTLGEQRDQVTKGARLNVVHSGHLQTVM